MPKYALTVVLFTLVGTLTSVIPHDDGYIIETQEVHRLYETKIGEPEPLVPGLPHLPDLRITPVLSVGFESKETFAEIRRSFVSFDVLTSEEINAYEKCIKAGPDVEWRVFPGKVVSSSPSSAPVTEKVCDALPISPVASTSKPKLRMEYVGNKVPFTWPGNQHAPFFA